MYMYLVSPFLILFNCFSSYYFSFVVLLEYPVPKSVPYQLYVLCNESKLIYIRFILMLQNWSIISL